MPEMNDQNLFERVLERREMFRGQLVNVEHWDVELPSGRTAQREIVRNANAAAVVPVDDDGYVTLVRQYRVAMQRILMEIPAGKKDDPREDPLLCAKRELEEETGLRAERFELLTHARMSPGFLTECVSIYLATGLSQGKDHPDEDEYLNVVRMPLDEAVALVASSEIDDAKTIAGLLLARLALKKKEE